jgi:hypothetical protein
MKDGYIPIADMSLYHAVPGNMNREKVVRLVGSYEGTGHLEKPLFSVVFRLPARTCGGILLH